MTNPPTTTPDLEPPTTSDLERAKHTFRHSAACEGVAWSTYLNRLTDCHELLCRGCNRTVEVALLAGETTTGRYVLTCVWCDQEIRLHRARPRVPLHPACARQRAKHHRPNRAA